MKCMHFILCASIMMPLPSICKFGYFSIRNHSTYPIKYFVENEGSVPGKTVLVERSGKKIDDDWQPINIEKPTTIRIISEIPSTFKTKYIFDPKTMKKAKNIHVAWEGTLRRQKGIFNFSQVEDLPKKSLSNNVTDDDIYNAGKAGSAQAD